MNGAGTFKTNEMAIPAAVMAFGFRSDRPEPLDQAVPVEEAQVPRQEAGLAEAQFNLAHCLATGNGTPRNDAEELTWMLSAAGQGLASAQYLAGVMLAEGVGGAPDRIWAVVHDAPNGVSRRIAATARTTK